MSKKVCIRKMTIDDYESVYALWLSCPGMGLNNIDDSKEGIRRFLRRNPDTCFVAEDETEGKIAGVIMTGHDGRRGYIYHTAVAAPYRKTGTGTNLVEAAMEALKREGISKVALVAFARNEGGNRFWEKQGFYSREDLTYRNRELMEMVNINT